LDVILRKVSELKKIAESLECTLPQLCIAWCAKNSYVTSVITGASRVEQVVENFASLKVIPKLTDDILEQMEKILQNKPKLPGGIY